MMDVAKIRKQIVDHLAERGFAPRDADGSDFARKDDTSVRFKVGTSYQEVTITYWHGKSQFGVTRIINEDRVEEALRQIDLVIPVVEVQEITDGNGHVVAVIDAPVNVINHSRAQPRERFYPPRRPDRDPPAGPPEVEHRD